MAQCPVYDYAVPINTCVTVFYVDFCWTTYICVNNDSGLVDYAVRPHRAPEPVVHVPEEPPNPKPGTVKK